jgi:hypothetical protein
MLKVGHSSLGNKINAIRTVLVKMEYTITIYLLCLSQNSGVFDSNIHDKEEYPLLSAVVQAYNPSYWGGTGRRTVV